MLFNNNNASDYDCQPLKWEAINFRGADLDTADLE